MTYTIPFFLAAACISLYTQCEAPPCERLITSVHIEKNRVSIAINEDFKQRWLKSDFFAEYDEDIDLTTIPYSIVLLPFVLNIYPVVWMSGRDYTIDCMDEDIFYSLERIKKVVERMYPHTSFKGNLIPDSLVRNQPPATLSNPSQEIAVLFSGGLDSTACSFEHSAKKQLLISVQGQEDLPVSNPHRWKERKKLFKTYAKAHGHNNAFIRTNYIEFLNVKALTTISPEITSWRLDTTEGVGLFGAAMPLLYSKGCTRLFIGSSYNWDFPYPTAANPLVDHSLCAAGKFSLHHEHFAHTRFDKVKLIVDKVKKNKAPIPFLRVCVFAHRDNNCCFHCRKCLTITNTLVALGEDLASYGFKCTPKEVIEHTKKYFSLERAWKDYWNMFFVQQKIRDLPELSPFVKENMQWFLTEDLWARVASSSIPGKTKIQWHDFKDLAPEGVVIPSVTERQKE